MISFILAEKGSLGELVVIERSEKIDNPKFLVGRSRDKYPLLSEIDLHDQDIYNYLDMNQFIDELNLLLKESSITTADILHVKNIIILAQKCKVNENLFLIVTAFGKFYNNVSL